MCINYFSNLCSYYRQIITTNIVIIYSYIHSSSSPMKSMSRPKHSGLSTASGCYRSSPLDVTANTLNPTFSVLDKEKVVVGAGPVGGRRCLVWRRRSRSFRPWPARRSSSSCGRRRRRHKKFVRREPSAAAVATPICWLWRLLRRVSVVFTRFRGLCSY